jgi:heme-degrading monooxygenase HmoA
MYVVIFRAQIRALDAAYDLAAARMRDLALTSFGCTGFHAVREGDHEVALSYWPTEAHILAWREHPEHLLAQQTGRDRWYTSYSVEVAQVRRAYHVGTLPPDPSHDDPSHDDPNPD